MKKFEMNVGQAEVIDQFFLEVASAPRQIKELVLLSPFVELWNQRSKSGKKLSQIIRNIKAAGGSAVLISDDTPTRREDFRKAIIIHPDMAGSLFVCEGLHAKCGFATNAFGYQVAFLGSANLTDAGLNKNSEIVFGFKGRALEGPGWSLLGQLRLMVARIYSNSITLTNV